MPQAPPPAGHQAAAPQTHSLLPSLPGAVPADHRGRLLSNWSAVVFGTSSFWLQLCFIFWARLWLWSRGCRPLHGKGPQQSGRVLSPAVPYSSWARESCTLLAAHLPRAKGSGRAAPGSRPLGPSAEADWTALAGPGVPHVSWQNGKWACVQSGPTSRGRAQATVLQARCQHLPRPQVDLLWPGSGCRSGDPDVLTPCPRLGPSAARAPKGSRRGTGGSSELWRAGPVLPH